MTGCHFLLLDTLKGPPSSAGLYCERARPGSPRLARAGKPPVYLFMHHPPFDIAHALMDLIKLDDADDFLGAACTAITIQAYLLRPRASPDQRPVARHALLGPAEPRASVAPGLRLGRDRLQRRAGHVCRRPCERRQGPSSIWMPSSIGDAADMDPDAERGTWLCDQAGAGDRSGQVAMLGELRPHRIPRRLCRSSRRFMTS